MSCQQKSGNRRQDLGRLQQRAFVGFAAITVSVAGLTAAGSACAGSHRKASPSAPCSTHSSADAASQPLTGYGGLSNDGTYYITYRPEPDLVPLNETFGITVEVRNAADRSRVEADVDLAVDARMPQHFHGMNTKPRVEKQGPGRFSVEGMLFHMPGSWQLYFDVTRRGLTERAQFDYEL